MRSVCVLGKTVNQHLVDRERTISRAERFLQVDIEVVFQFMWSTHQSTAQLLRGETQTSTQNRTDTQVVKRVFARNSIINSMLMWWRRDRASLIRSSIQPKPDDDHHRHHHPVQPSVEE